MSIWQGAHAQVGMCMHHLDGLARVRQPCTKGHARQHARQSCTKGHMRVSQCTSAMREGAHARQQGPDRPLPVPCHTLPSTSTGAALALSTHSVCVPLYALPTCLHITPRASAGSCSLLKPANSCETKDSDRGNTQPGPGMENAWWGLQRSLTCVSVSSGAADSFVASNTFWILEQLSASPSRLACTPSSA